MTNVPDYSPRWTLRCARCDVPFRWPSNKAVYCPDCRKVQHEIAVARVQLRVRLRLLLRVRPRTRKIAKEIELLRSKTQNLCGRCGRPIPTACRLCPVCFITRRRQHDATYRRARTRRTVYAPEVDGYDGATYAPVLTR